MENNALKVLFGDAKLKFLKKESRIINLIINDWITKFTKQIYSVLHKHIAISYLVLPF